MATSDLKTEVQTRIDNIVYSSGTLQAAEVMQGAIDAFGLNCDLTNITSVYNSMEAAVTSGTSANDITALNVIATSLGINSPATAGASQIIGSLKTLHVDDTDGLHVDSNGDAWLKTGVISTDVASYPDAKTSTPAGAQTGGVYTTNNLPILALTYPKSLEFYAGHFWILNYNEDTVHKYTSAGTATGITADISSQTTYPHGIAIDGNYLWVLSDVRIAYRYSLVDGSYVDSISFATQGTTGNSLVWDGTHMWMMSDDDTVYKFDTSGVYQNESFSVAGEGTTSQDITWDGFYFYVYHGDEWVYRYTSAGVYTGEKFDTIETQAQAICFDGTNLWVAGSAYDRLYEYTGYVPFVGGQYAGLSIYTGSQDTVPIGITWGGGYFWVLGNSNEFVYKYNPDGSYTGFSFDTNPTEGAPTNLVWADGFIWIVGLITNSALKFTELGVYTTESFSLSSQTTKVNGITWDGTYFWISAINNDIVYKYSSTGVYQNESYTLTDVTENGGICWDGTYFWVSDNTSDTLLQYDSSWVYLNNAIILDSVDSPNFSARGCCWDGTHMHVLDNSTDSSYSWSGLAPYIGIPTAEYDISSGYPKYLKIKGGA